jgi:3-oxoadipate CoA-transferase beta subunit
MQAPPREEIDPWLINAGKQYVTLRQGGSFATTTAPMIRGGHPICVLGAFRCGERRHR